MRTPSDERRSGRKRVAVVVNAAGPSGAMRDATDQAACLDPAEWQVEIASLELAGGPRSVSRQPRLVPVRRPGLARFAHWLHDFRPDLVHAHLAPATLACRAALPFAGEPAMVAACHELSDWRERRYEPLRLLARAALHHCSVVLAATEAVRAAIVAEDAGLAGRTRVLRQGTDLSGFSAVRGMRAGARALLGYRPGTFVVGAIGRLEPSAGLDLLLEAASIALHRVPGLELLIVGDGAERGRLVALASERGLSARVRFVGEQADVRPYLAAFDLFAAPWRTEGSAVALAEAMAAGVPVAGSPAGCIAEVLEGGKAGWLVPLTPEAWPEAIVRAARSRAELQHLSDAGRVRAGEFSLEHMRDQLAASYRTALDARGDRESLAA